MSDKKTHWERIYGDKAPHEVSWFQPQPTLSLQLIKDIQLPQNAAIIDVGGGSSVLVDHLLAEGYTDLSVLDISAKALAYAQNRLGEKASQVSWYEKDVTQFVPDRRFSLWHDRAVFHFLTEKSDRVSYVEILKRTLVLGGHLIIAAFALGGPSKCSGLDIVQYDAEKLISELGEAFKLIAHKTEIHTTPTNLEQKFAYFHCVRR